MFSEKKSILASKFLTLVHEFICSITTFINFFRGSDFFESSQLFNSAIIIFNNAWSLSLALLLSNRFVMAEKV